MNGRAIFLVAACAAATARAAPEALRLRGEVTLAGPPGDPAVAFALRDLSDDFHRVLGQPARRVDGTNASVVVRLDPSIGTPEGWRIDAGPAQVVISAADPLGAVHGIYAFSGEFLGVDPLWFWKDLEPARRDEVAIPAQTRASRPPAFRYRGWFVNDEDLLTEWKPGSGARDLDYPFYGQVISLDVADRIFEALLRCGGNLAIPASFVDVMNPPEAELVRRAVERGLYVTQHHIEPLGVSHFGFETYWKRRGESVAFSYSADPERVRKTWAAYAARWRELAGDRVVWQLGLRGRGDRPVWASDKGVTTNDAGSFVSRAFADQWAIVRSVDPRPSPPATATLWMEGSQLMRRGTLKFPPGVAIVFADEGRSQMLQDDFRTAPREDGRARGVYYHLAFWSEGPHLVQGTRPAKMKRSFDELIARGDTNYAIVNVANVREHVLGIEAAMGIMREGAAWDEAAFMDRWAPPAVRAAYGEFLASFVELQGDRLLQDGTCWVLAGRLLTALEKNVRPVVNSCVPVKGSLADALGASIERLDRLIAGYPTAAVPADRRAFHDANLRVQAAILRHYYGCLRELLRTYDDRSRAPAAVGELEELLRVRATAATGKWENWYRGDRKENVPALLERTRRLAARTPAGP